MNNFDNGSDNSFMFSPSDAAMSVTTDELFKTKRFAEALQRLSFQFEKTKDIVCLLNMGACFSQMWRFEEALSVLNRYMSARVDRSLDYAVYVNMSFCYIKTNRTTDALSVLTKALSFRETPEALCNLGIVYRDMGDIKNSVKSYLRAYEIDHQKDPAKYSGYLMTLNYSDMSSEEMFEKHKTYGEIIDKQTPQLLNTSMTTRSLLGKKMKIGYLSTDFRRHSAAYLIEGIIEAHDRNVVEVCVFDDNIFNDETNARIKSKADASFRVAGMSDEAFKRLVIQNNIDVLVDMIGHSDTPRLPVLAKRCAPVQATWIGYPNTTGLLSAIDLRIVDEVTDPPGSEKFCTEELVRINGGFIAYRPPENHRITPPPVSMNGHITFGCFSYFGKVQDRCVKTWSEILKSVPGSRLLMKFRGVEDERLRERITNKFYINGIGDDRIEFSDYMPDSLSMVSHNYVDIMLDTFPYNGTVTTLESLWMGVPVVALCGQTHAGRVSASILRHTEGLGKWVAESEEQYVKIAVDLANDKDALLDFRKNGRAEMKKSPILDARRVAKQLEDAFTKKHSEKCKVHIPIPGSFKIPHSTY